MVTRPSILHRLRDLRMAAEFAKTGKAHGDPQERSVVNAKAQNTGISEPGAFGQLNFDEGIVDEPEERVPNIVNRRD